MLNTLASLWYIAYEYVRSWFIPKPVIRPVTPPFIYTTRKYRTFAVKKPPIFPKRGLNTVSQSTKAFHYNQLVD